MAQIETYILKVDSKHQASYDACKGAYILHYMYDANGACQGVFNGGVTARRWIKRNAGPSRGINGPIQFEANLEKPIQSF